MKTALAVLALGASWSAALAADATGFCRFDNTGFPGLTFDVTKYIAQGNQDYIWNDLEDMDSRNFTYTFNLCKNTATKPGSTCGGTSAPAWQYETHTKSCYAMGADVSKTPILINTRVHDPDKPALGFDLTYNGGSRQFCGANNDINRSFKMTFLCNSAPFHTPNATVAKRAFIRESGVCQYEAYSFSQAGCPTQCQIYDGKVCGGNGVCRYDTDANKARCFCNDGYQSSNGCKPVKDVNPGGAIAGAVIGGIAMGALGVAAWWWFTQRNKPASTDDYAYSGALN